MKKSIDNLFYMFAISGNDAEDGSDGEEEE